MAVVAWEESGLSADDRHRESAQHLPRSGGCIRTETRRWASGVCATGTRAAALYRSRSEEGGQESQCQEVNEKDNQEVDGEGSQENEHEEVHRQEDRQEDIRESQRRAGK